MQQEEIRVVLKNEEKPSEFSTKLCTPLELDSQWKVGLTEITFSKNPLNFSFEDYLICKNFDKNVNKKVSLNPDSITSGEKLIQVINQVLREERLIPGVQFRFEEITNKALLILQPNRGVEFSKRLATVLSLKESIENKTRTESRALSEYCIDPRLHFWNIYIYSNLTKPVILGEKLFPILQTLPAENFNENYLSKSFNPPMLIPLSSYYIPDIKLKICDELGRPLRFKSSCSVLCKLVFKKSL